jgi:hypothetical protein
MTIAANTSHGNGPVRYATLAVIGLLWMTSCATTTSELKQELEVMLKETRDEVRQETNRMDTEVAQLRSEVGVLRSEVGRVDSAVGRLGANVRQLGSEVTLVQTEMGQNDTSLVDMAVRLNQLDRRVAKSERQALQYGERASKPSDGPGGPVGEHVATAAVAAPPEDSAKTLKRGMSQQDVQRLFGSPHGKERILDSVYWYYADGALKGQYVRFDATTSSVNGWSTFSPRHFEIDLRTTQGRHVR